MNRYILIILVIAAAGAKQSFADSTYISPSFYYTYGDYSNSMSSNSFAFFNTLQISERLYLINSYDNLNIKTPTQIGWEYSQQLFLGGLYYNAYPYFIKGNYSYILGKYNWISDGSYNYKDISHLFNVDFVYYQNLFYYGASYNYFISNGILNADSLKTRRIHQLTLRWEYIVSPSLFISIKPNYSRVDDGRDLISAELKIRYLVLNGVVINTGGFYGSRAYYFDSDLLTIFNQNYTQKYRLFGQIDFYPFNAISLSAGYQHTKFNDFSINYLVAGIKGYFWL